VVAKAVNSFLLALYSDYSTLAEPSLAARDNIITPVPLSRPKAMPGSIHV
jgi:hypothetical protein